MESFWSKIRICFGNFREVKTIPIIFLFIVIFCYIILSAVITEEQNVGIIGKLRNYIPTKLQNHWNLIINPNCNFENYIFGQPIQQTDPCLISTFKTKLLLAPPPLKEQPQGSLNISGEIPGNIEKFKWIEKLIIQNPKNLQNISKILPGFFIECGANDGEFISPTIRLEKQYKWQGLLIEPNPIPFQNLLKKKRNSWTANVAVCTSQNPELINFYTNPKNTGLSGLNARVPYGVSVNLTVQCLPLYTMLAAMDIKIVDYLSLDVEGSELAVLKTLPFDKIKFKVMTIEFGLIPGKQKALKDFLETKGYKFVKEIRDQLTLDCLYVHESLYELAKTIKI